MISWGFDYLGWLYDWNRRPQKWRVLRTYEQRDWADVYGCTVEQLELLILNFRKVR